jgi:hypothetical protein
MSSEIDDYTPKVYNKYHKTYPKGSVYIGRGSFYGNEFKAGVHGDRDQVCDLYEAKKMKDASDDTVSLVLSHQIRLFI